MSPALRKKDSGEVLSYNPANNRFVDKFVPTKQSRSWTRPALVFGSNGDLFLSSAATSEVTPLRWQDWRPKGALPYPPASAASMGGGHGLRLERQLSSKASWATRCWSTTARPAHSSVSSSPRGAGAIRSRPSSSSDPLQRTGGIEVIRKFQLVGQEAHLRLGGWTPGSASARLSSAGWIRTANRRTAEPLRCEIEVSR